MQISATDRIPSGTISPAQESPMLTIRQAYDSFYVPNHPDIAATTRAKYSFEILRWERHTSNPTVDHITTETFNQFRASALAAGLKAVTIESAVRSILQVLRIVGPESERRQGLGLISRVPYCGRSLKDHTPLRATPTVDELKLLCLFARHAIWPKGVDQQTWWRAWIGTAFVTGLRLADMLRLESTMLKGDVLTVSAQKTGAKHLFVLPDWLLTELTHAASGGKLLPSKPLPCFIRRELRRLSDKCAVPLVTPHGIRRASITEWSAISDTAGRIIHGCGLGVRSRYIAVERILRKRLKRLPRLF